MFFRAVSSGLTLLFRTPRLAAVAAMSTGTFVQLEPLNYRGGARVEPVDSSGTEKAFEPATGKPGWTRVEWALLGPVHWVCCPLSSFRALRKGLLDLHGCSVEHRVLRRLVGKWELGQMKPMLNVYSSYY